MAPKRRYNELGLKDTDTILLNEFTESRINEVLHVDAKNIHCEGKGWKSFGRRRTNAFERKRKCNRRKRIRHLQFKNDLYVWKSKRMKMVTRWGMKLPECRRDQHVGNVHQAYKKHCTIYDASYYKVIRVAGNMEDIRNTLIQCTNPVLHEDIMYAKELGDEFMIYGNFPFGAVAPVNGMWVEECVWLWCHPAGSDQVEMVLKENSTGDVVIEMVEHDMARFQIRGVRSFETIDHVLSLKKSLKWKEVYRKCKGRFQRMYTIETKEYEGSMASPERKERGIVCPVTNKVVENVDAFLQHADVLLQKWTDLCDEDGNTESEYPGNLDNYVAESKHRYSMQGPHRCEKGFQNIPKHRDTIKMVVVVSKSGGYDFIFDTEHAKSMWQYMIFAGARAIGRQEKSAIQAIAGEPSFPEDYPDTKAGTTWWKEQQQLGIDLQNKRPLGKRINYSQNGIESPLSPEFEKLLSSDAYCVLRGATYHDPFVFASRINATKIPMAIPTLVFVSLTLPRKGKIVTNAKIFMPSSEDLSMFKSLPNWSSGSITNTNRALAGYVTTSACVKSSAKSFAIGFCCCSILQDMFLMDTLRDDGAALGMVQMENSPLCRPCIVKIQPNIRHI